MQSLKKIHAWAQMKVPLNLRNDKKFGACMKMETTDNNLGI